MTIQPNLTGTDEKLITGYQYGATNQFIGEYQIHNNQDKDELHMPPNTTLVSPPFVPKGKQAIWNEKKQNWDLKNEPEFVKTKAIQEELPVIEEK